MNQSLHLTKDRLAWIILSDVILSKLKVNNRTCLQLWQGADIGRLLRPDIVQFHFACLGTEIFLRELTLSSTLSSNPKSSRSVDLQFLHKLLFYLHKFYDKFFIVQRHA